VLPINKPSTATVSRVRLQDMTCPLIRVDDARRREKRDKSMGFMCSVILHLVVFGVAGLSLIKQPQFGVDQGLSGMEVDLVAPAVETPKQEVLPPPEEAKSDFVEPAPAPVGKTEPSPVATQGKDEVTMKSTGGAITEAKPDYLKNPAPSYPESARRRGYQGAVMLRAVIDKTGTPIQVDIEQSSGHSLLDEAALKAVQKWRFRPGLLGNIPVESTVRVPIKFDLQDAR
jgi:TonB family protein